jgi:hypothetical protein
MMHALALLTALMPAAAFAEPWACSFTVECVAGEACGESGFEVELIAADHAGELFLSTVTGDSRVAPDRRGRPARHLCQRGARRVGGASDRGGRRHRADDVHIFDGVAAAVTYFGTCEELR